MDIGYYKYSFFWSFHQHAPLSFDISVLIYVNRLLRIYAQRLKANWNIFPENTVYLLLAMIYTYSLILFDRWTFQCAYAHMLLCWILCSIHEWSMSFILHDGICCFSPSFINLPQFLVCRYHFSIIHIKSIYYISIYIELNKRCRAFCCRCIHDPYGDINRIKRVRSRNWCM